MIKIGFHAGVGGTRTGIGEYMQLLADAGKPWIIKSVDDIGLVLEAAKIARATRPADATIILRFATFWDDGMPDVPDYSLHPETAALSHWRRLNVLLHRDPELDFYKSEIFVEPCNELRTHWDENEPNYNNMHPVDWLADFMSALSNMMLAAGWSIALPGMNIGTPEPGDWLRPKMAAFLKEFTGPRIIITLHEGKLGGPYSPIESEMPHHIGRFQYLHEAADILGIPRPNIVMSEWGWAYNDMPDIDTAMSDLRILSRVIAEHQNIKGVCLWNLAGGTQWANLPDKLQKLIKPITEATLATPTPPPGNDRPKRIKHTIHIIPQNTTAEELQAITAHLHPTRSAFTYSHDVVDAVAAHGTPDTTIYIWEPGRWNMDLHDYYAQWGVQTVSKYFNELISPPPPSPPPPPTDTSAHDLLAYMLGDGTIYELQVKNGPQERAQTQRGKGNIFYHVKGNPDAANWEELSFDERFIYRRTDTSQSATEFYRLSQPGKTEFGSAWAPRRMTIGQVFRRNALVTHMRKHAPCGVTNQGWVSSTIKLVAIHPTITFFTKITLSDVMELFAKDDTGALQETYYYHRQFGLVGFRNHEMESAISEIHPPGSRPDSIRHIPPCL